MSGTVLVQQFTLLRETDLDLDKAVFDLKTIPQTSIILCTFVRISYKTAALLEFTPRRASNCSCVKESVDDS